MPDIPADIIRLLMRAAGIQEAESRPEAPANSNSQPVGQMAQPAAPPPVASPTAVVPAFAGTEVADTAASPSGADSQPLDVPTPSQPSVGPAGITQQQLDAALARQRAELIAQLTTPATAPAQQPGKSIMQKLADGDPVSNAELDAAWDSGEISKHMNDLAGSRTEVRV